MPFALGIRHRGLDHFRPPRHKDCSEVLANPPAVTAVREVTFECGSLGFIQRAVSFSEELRLSLAAVHDDAKVRWKVEDSAQVGAGLVSSFLRCGGLAPGVTIVVSRMTLMIASVAVPAVRTGVGFDPDAVGVVGEVSRLTIALGVAPAVGANDPAFWNPRLDLDLFPVSARRSNHDSWRGSIHDRGWTRVDHGGRGRGDDDGSRMMENGAADTDTNVNTGIGAS